MPSTPQRKLNLELLDEESFGRLPPMERLLLWGLLHKTDGFGRWPAHPSRIRLAIFEFDATVTDELVEIALMRLEELGWLQLYYPPDSSRAYLQVLRWDHWMSIDTRGVTSEFPAPPGPSALSAGSPRPALGQTGVEGGEAEARSGEAREAAAAPPSPPSRPQLSPTWIPPWYCTKHPNGIGAGETRCGPCGTARKQHDLALAGELSRADIEAIHAERERAIRSRQEPTDD